MSPSQQSTEAFATGLRSRTPAPREIHNQHIEIQAGCWIAPRNIPLGSAYQIEIVKALEYCRAILLIFSEAANKSEHILREVELAAQERSVVASDSMNSCTEAIWRFSEMNSKADALTARIREPRDAPRAACMTGHSSINPRSVAHVGMSRSTITSSASRARHGAWSRQCLPRAWRRARFYRLRDARCHRA